MLITNIFIIVCMVYQTTSQNVVRNEDMEEDLESFRKILRRNDVTISQTLNNLSQHFHLDHKTVTLIFKSLNQNKRVQIRKVTNANVCEMSEHANDVKLLRLIRKKLNEAKRRRTNTGKCSKKPSICRKCCRIRYLPRLARKFCAKRCNCAKWKRKWRKKWRQSAFRNLNKLNKRDAPSNSLKVPRSLADAAATSAMTRVMSSSELSVLNDLRIAAVAIATLDGCTNKGELTDIGTLNMCNSCKYNIEFPSVYTPQFIAHHTCGEPGNMGCFFSQGLCAKNVRGTRIARIDPVTSIVLNEFQLDLTACCSCEILPTSVLSSLVT